MANADATFALSDAACLVAVSLFVEVLSVAPVSGGWCVRSTRLLCTLTAICCSNELVSFALSGDVDVHVGNTKFLIVQSQDEEAGKRFAGVNVIVDMCGLNVT